MKLIYNEEELSLLGRRKFLTGSELILKNQIAKKIKRLLSKVKVKKNPSFYVEKGRALLKVGKRHEAYKIFNKGLKNYPDNYNLLKELAYYAMSERSWREANYYWDIIFKLDEKELLPQLYLDFAKSLLSDNQVERSIDILSLGITLCSDNKKIISTLAELLMIDKEESNSRNCFPPSELSADNKKLFSSYVNRAIYSRDWDTAIQRLENVSKVYRKSISRNILIKLSMLYQIVGNTDKANNIFLYSLDHYPEENKNDKKGYRKIVLFDNGESRIEFYKKLSKTDTVVITFDSINMTWRNPSFAFNLLIKQNVDIIAIRKRRKSTYQQDLSLDDFFNAVHLLAKGYKDRVAYGFSLGAYGSLYYASTLNCRILALSPRLSIHPIYGKTKMIGKFEFRHNELPNYNPKISPIIVYDPKNKLDNYYINNGLIASFPNAHKIEIPYAGHGMGPHLKNMGVLKEFILTVINDKKAPTYKKELRKRSATYYRVLGDACLKRNKPNWALNLVERALNLTPESNLCIRLKIHVLKRLELYEQAIQFAQTSKEIVPADRVIRLLLIDLYFLISDFKNAEREINIAIKKFGETPALLKKKEQIQS